MSTVVAAQTLPTRLGFAAPSPRSQGTPSSPRKQDMHSPRRQSNPPTNRVSTPRSPPAPFPRPTPSAWPVVSHPPRASEGLAQCILRLDALPVRAICADERLIYLAEAPLRAQYASHASTQHAGRLSAREPRSGRVSRTLSGAGGHAISCLLATSDGHLWSGSFDGLVRVSRRGGQALHEARAHSSTVHALAEACVSSTAATVFSAGSDFLIRAWSLSLAPLRTMRAHTCPVHSLAAFAAPAASAAGASGVHEVWSGGDDHVIHIWSASEASGFAHVASLDDFGAPIRVLATQLSAAAARVWAADTLGTLRVYHASSHAALRTILPAGAAAPTSCITATATGSVWVGDTSGGLTIYDGTSTAPLARFEGAHLGCVGGLASPGVSAVLGTGGLASPGARHGAVALVWSFGADASVRVWGMSEQLPERLTRARESIDSQHQSLSMIRSMLPRATAAAAGRLEAAAQRSELLTRRMLDLEVAMSVGAAPLDVYHGGAITGARDGPYEAGVESINEAHRQVTEEVQEALLACKCSPRRPLPTGDRGGARSAPCSSRPDRRATGLCTGTPAARSGGAAERRDERFGPVGFARSLAERAQHGARFARGAAGLQRWIRRWRWRRLERASARSAIAAQSAALGHTAGAERPSVVVRDFVV